MDIELRADFEVSDESCRSATGKTLAQWSEELSSHPEFEGKRRPATNWLWDHTGRNPAGAWWGITIWVEHERRVGKLGKDGRIEGYGICCTKSVAAPAALVQSEVGKLIPNITRVREGKDTRAAWETPGGSGVTDLEILFAERDGKTGITVNHTRFQTREEADGLRRFWTSRLDEVKKKLEGK